MSISFKQYLGEMTHVDPSVSSKMLYDYLETIEPVFIYGGGVTHIGDIEDFELCHVKDNTYEVYALRKDNEVACVFKCQFKTLPKVGQVLYVYVMVTKPTFQKKSLSAKMINFFNTRELWHVVIDDLISPANKANLEKIAKDEQSSAGWINVKTGEIDNFLNTDGKYKFRFHEPDTNWHVIFQKRYKALDEGLYKSLEWYSRYKKNENTSEIRMIIGYDNIAPGTD